ncbi:hypothetical protein [Hymenobacter rubidus]|nr:hypothetical protein [Hymenobacter rubidus]
MHQLPVVWAGGAAIPMRNCIGGQPDNLGDLNDNGGDEVGLRPDWFAS